MSEHTKIHKKLDSNLNQLVADFIEHSGVPPHLATVHQLLEWSRRQAVDVDHANDKHSSVLVK